MAKIVWSKKGLEDFTALLSFIELDSLQNARKVAARIFDRIGQLEQYPELGRIVPELSRDDIRELIVYRFRIVYRHKNRELVEIVGIHHSSMLLTDNNID